jgi:S-adenosylmethionine synthetase
MLNGLSSLGREVFYMLRTAESVSPKHPDKICDQISDSVLDEILKQDEFARVAVETVGGHKKVLLTGEVTTNAKVDYEKVARKFVPKEYEVKINIVEQSPEIAQGVDTGGAGDQGIMVGYATSETENLIPLEADLARELNQLIFSKFPHDGKTQVTVENGLIQSVVASFQHAKSEELEEIIKDWLKDKDHEDHVKIFPNPAGDWDQGGFESDVGLTGRKLAVDNYGPRIPLGGGAFSGKDATKVDRSAAYMARKVAVDYLKKHEAKEVYCYLAYAIGVAEPVQASVIVDGKEMPVEGYNLTPKGIIEFLELRKPQFAETAKWGHMGNSFKWG